MAPTNTKKPLQSRKMAKKRKNRKDLSLKDVLDAGCDKDDYEMLKDVNISEDLVTEADDKEKSNGVDNKAISDFISELGFDTLTPEFNDAVEDQDGLSSEDENSKKMNTEMLKKKAEISKNSSGKQKNLDKLPESFLSDVNVELHTKLVVNCSEPWFDQIPQDPTNFPLPGDSLVKSLQSEAIKLLQNETAIFQKDSEKSNSSDAQWIKTVLASGTLGDKVAARALLIKESPVHRLNTLDSFLTMAKKRGRREAIMAVETLKELWLQDLLPENRKLKLFTQYPLSLLEDICKLGGGKTGRRKRLILWYFEDQIKSKYLAFIQALEELLKDNLPEIRNKMLGVVFDLLVRKPEQEKVLLTQLVNKVGDPNRKVASKASFLLGQLVQKHPNMKPIIMKEVERLLYRPNINLKAQYYAICFLNQLILTKKDGELAANLVSLYFKFFKVYVEKKDVESKMLSALLTGVNRAYPFTKVDDEKFNEELNTLFRVVHIAHFNTSVQALMLLFQVMDSKLSVSDRFYQALYGKMLDPQLKTSSKQTMFLNILYKSIKADPSLPRVKAFIKRLLQICTFQQPHVVCGILFLVSEITKLRPEVKSLVFQPEDQDDEEHFEDAAEPEDDIQDLPQDSSDEEHTDKQEENKTKMCQQSKSGDSKKDQHSSKSYDIAHRNPLYCGAENSCSWEIDSLTSHFHPSVGHFAGTIIKGDKIVYTSDPLQDFTIMRFLDTFVYKNPKKNTKEHGGSIMQPKKQFESKRTPVNHSTFIAKSEDKVSADELFYYRYFKRKAEVEKNESIKKEKTDINDNLEEDFSAEEMDFDFASEMKKSGLKPKSKKKHKKESDDEDSEDESSDDEGDDEDISDKDGDSEDEEEFNYEDMEMSEEDFDEPGPSDSKKKWTEKDYEKVLLENLSSDEFSDDEEPKSKKKRKGKKAPGIGDTSLFAAADEFAHLLEESESAHSGTRHDVSGSHKMSQKQMKWEENRMSDQQGRKRKRGPNKQWKNKQQNKGNVRSDFNVGKKGKKSSLKGRRKLAKR